MQTGGHSSAGPAGEGRRSPFLSLVLGIGALIDWSGRIIATACLAFMFVALLVNVILRYMFGSGIAWAYEIHAVLLPWLVAGGIVIAAAQGRNIAVDLLPSMLPPNSRRVLDLIIQVAIIVICVRVLWAAQPILKASTFQTLSTLGIKQVWGYASLVFAFAGMAVIGLVNIVRIFIEGSFDERRPENASLS